jgi:hypothetical protein
MTFAVDICCTAFHVAANHASRKHILKPSHMLAFTDWNQDEI